MKKLLIISIYFFLISLLIACGISTNTVKEEKITLSNVDSLVNTKLDSFYNTLGLEEINDRLVLLETLDSTDTIGDTVTSGNWLYIHNQVIDIEHIRYDNYDSVVIENCTYNPSHSDIYGSLLSFSNIGTLRIEDCKFLGTSRNGNKDRHAINITHNIDKVIIKKCTFNDICADGIQLGELLYADTSFRYINNVLIEDCYFINDPLKSVENGIDWKGGCVDSGVINNCYFSGFKFCDETQGCTGSNGEAIVLHYNLTNNVSITNCVINNSNIGISVVQGSGTPISEGMPGNIKLFNNRIDAEQIGIQAWLVDGISMYNNIITNAYNGFWLSGVNDMVLINNTLVNCYWEPLVEYITSTGNREYSNNLIVGNYNGVFMDILGQQNFEIEDINVIKFTDDYRLTSASDTVIDKGYNNGLLYDIDGDLRSTIDIGADEFINY